jgi:hypothetical protein
MGQTQGTYATNTLLFRDTIMSPPVGSTPWGNFPELAILCDPGAGFEVYDDFLQLSDQATNGLWLVTKGTGGSIGLSSSLAGGWVSIPTAASANDYQVFSTQQKSFNLASGLDSCFEAMIQVTEAATNASSWYVGFTSTVTSGFLQNSGAPASSFSGVVLWKATGAMAVKCMTSNGSTQSSSGTLATAVSGTTLIVGAYVNHNDNTTAIVTPYICTVAANARTLVGVGPTQNLTLASLANMYFSFGVRAGSGGTAETLLVDYVQAAQGRYYQ